MIRLVPSGGRPSLSNDLSDEGSVFPVIQLAVDCAVGKYDKALPSTNRRAMVVAGMRKPEEQRRSRSL